MRKCVIFDLDGTLLDTLEDPCEFENRIADPRYAADLARLREAVIEHFMGKVLP